MLVLSAPTPSINSMASPSFLFAYPHGTGLMLGTLFITTLGGRAGAARGFFPILR